MIERAPSAELRPDQLDSDSLPPYDLLDRILEAYVERDQGREEMIAAGMPAATVDDVIRLVDRSEYKRRQAAPGIRITPGVRQGPPPADHQPLRRLALLRNRPDRDRHLGEGAELALVVERPRRPRPRWCGRGGGPWRVTSAPPSVTGRMKLTLIDWPIAIIPSSSTARAVAREQMLSTRVDITPPWRRPTGWRSSSRSSIRTRAWSGSSSSHSVPTRASKWECSPRGIVGHRGEP